MSRKAAEAPKAENHERWIVSYADMLTLLFALFGVKGRHRFKIGSQTGDGGRFEQGPERQLNLKRLTHLADGGLLRSNIGTGVIKEGWLVGWVFVHP